MVNAQTSTIEQQIQQQREAIKSQEQILSQQAKKLMSVSQQELRGIPSRKGRVNVREGILKKRIKRGRVRDVYNRELSKLKNMKARLEKEIAKYYPEYGLTPYIQQEYQKSKQRLIKRINTLEENIKHYKTRLKKERNSSIKRSYETDLRAEEEELSTLKKYLKDKFKAIKGVNTGIAFKEASLRKDYIYKKARARQEKRNKAKELGFKSLWEYEKALPTLKKLSRGKATLKDIENLPIKLKEQISKIEIPSEQISSLGKERILVKDTSIEGIMQKLGYAGISTAKGVKWVKVPTSNKIEKLVKYYSKPKDIILKSDIKIPKINLSFQQTEIEKIPTVEELKRREEANRKGSFENLSNIAGEKTGQFFNLKPVGATTTFIRKIPIELPRFRFDKALVGQKKDLWEYRKIHPLLETYKAKNVGEFSLEFKRKFGDIIGWSSTGWGDIARSSEKFSIGKPKILKGLFKGISTSSEGVKHLLLPITEPVVQYSTMGGIGGGTLDILAIEQKKKEHLKEIVNKEKERAYKEYLKEVKDYKKNLKKGEKIDVLSKKDFYKEVDKDVTNQVLLNLNKEEFLPALFVAGGIVGKGISAYKEFNVKPTLIKRGKKVLVTTKGREFLGKLLKKPQEAKYFDITYKKVTPRYSDIYKYLKGHVKEGEPLIIRSQTGRLINLGNLKANEFDVKLFQQIREPGYKAIVTKPARTHWWEFTKPKEPKILYHGNPFTSIGKLERAKIINFFNTKGFSEDYAKNLIRLKTPRLTTIKGDFKELMVSLRGKPVSFLKGMSVSKSEIQQLGNIKTRGGITKVRFTNDFSELMKSKGKLSVSKSLTRQDLSLKGEKGGIFQKLSNKGKSTEFYSGITFSKKVGKVDIVPEINIKTGKKGFILGKDINAKDSFNLYYGKSLIKKRYPSRMKVKVSPKINLFQRLSKTEGGDIIDISRGGSSNILKKVSEKEITAHLERVSKILPIEGERMIKNVKIKNPINLKSNLKVSGVTSTIKSIHKGKTSKMTGNVIINKKQKEKVLNIPPEISKVSPKENHVEISKIKLGPKIKTSYKAKGVLKPLSIIKPTQTHILSTRNIQVTSLKIKPKLKLRKMNVIKPIHPIVSVGYRPTPIHPKTEIIRKPTKIIIPFEEKKAKPIRIIKRKKKPEEFFAITKRYGKEIIVGKGKDLGKVIGIGLANVKGTLGATLKVKTARGKEVALPLLKGFRKSKTDPLAIVQVKETRLGTLGEVSEIKRERRKLFNIL